MKFVAAATKKPRNGRKRSKLFRGMAVERKYQAMNLYGSSSTIV
jgi:hypothetical protein